MGSSFHVKMHSEVQLKLETFFFSTKLPLRDSFSMLRHGGLIFPCSHNADNKTTCDCQDKDNHLNWQNKIAEASLASLKKDEDYGTRSPGFFSRFFQRSCARAGSFYGQQLQQRIILSTSMVCEYCIEIFWFEKTLNIVHISDLNRKFGLHWNLMSR